MRQSIRIGTFAGIAVGVNWSVLVILALFAWELAYYVLPTTTGAPTATDWVAGVIGAVVLLVSLLAHEVSHALVARHNGVGVRSITLWMFGGVAQLEGEAHTAGADFRIAAVGPGTSVVLAVGFGAAQLRGLSGRRPWTARRRAVVAMEDQPSAGGLQPDPRRPSRWRSHPAGRLVAPLGRSPPCLGDRSTGGTRLCRRAHCRWGPGLLVRGDHRSVACLDRALPLLCGTSRGAVRIGSVGAWQT